MATTCYPLFFVFDFGGVLTSNAFRGMAEYSGHVFEFVEGRNRCDTLPPAVYEAVVTYLRRKTQSFFSVVNKFSGAFQDLERGRISRGEYCRGFSSWAKKCVDQWYRRQLDTKFGAHEKWDVETRQRALEHGMVLLRDLCGHFDVEVVMSIIERSPLRRNVIELIDFIKRETSHVASPCAIRLGLITNNWRGMGVKEGISAAIQHTLAKQGDVVQQRSTQHEPPFHVIVESCKEGQRKPDAGIFATALRRLLDTVPGADEATKPTFVFFDDLEPNCKGAMLSGVVSQSVLVDSPASVYDGIVRWLEIAEHTVLAAAVRHRFQPLFAQSAAAAGTNYLFFPPPKGQNLVAEKDIPVRNRFSEEEKARLLRYLACAAPLYFPMDSQLMQDGGPLFVEYFKGGMSNPTFRLTLRTGSFVLRKQPKGSLLKGAHDVSREYYIMRHLRTKGSVPVPHVLHLCSDVSVLGTPFYVMKFVEGEVLRPQGVVAHPRSKEIIMSLVDVLAEIHKAGPPRELLKERRPQQATSGHRDKPHPMQRVVETWLRQYTAGNDQLRSAIVSAPRKNGQDEGPFLVPALEELGHRLMALYRDQALPQQQPTLVHGDYNFGNMILDGLETPTPRVAAVLDFELSHVGDPLSDVGYLCLFYRLPPPMGFHGVEGSQRLPTIAEIVDRYSAASGILATMAPAERSRVVSIYVATAAFKMAGITHGIVCRARLGNASDVAAGLSYTFPCEIAATVGLELLQQTASGTASIAKL